ncbi:unnamed protein product [Bursaphelenchus okinawaensis]|uniref:Uncharacterized protein n=1 Tax=Bursaphelenchus okinawaensis TaxID=465554 RepID=A0A811K898_9BILA|nr:unnamed protein product [Bursaphelenchus okinawaensis]CAG9093871.1 unnamed protein product [Bursaphelenchus okinawaensis]
MSEKSINSIEKKTSIVLEPGVSAVKESIPQDGGCTIIIRVLLATLFMTAGLLAILYSINNAEPDEHEKNTTVEGFNAIYRNQISLNGILTIESKKREDKNIEKHAVQWIQDHDRQFVLLNISNSDNDFVEYFVQSDKMFVLNNKECTNSSNVSGYMDFFVSLGLQGLKSTRNEIIKVNDKMKEVEVYQDRPSLHFSFDESDNLPKYAIGYQGAENGLFYGWQLYYDTEESATEWKEFWFEDMKQEVPNPDIFFDLLKRCSRL